MPEIIIKDPREVDGFETSYIGGRLRISIKGGYMSSFYYDESPTGNCQLGSAISFYNIISYLNKYKIRDLFIKMKKANLGLKRLLLLDLNRMYADRVVGWLAPGCIVGNMPYISSNGSEMNILIIKLSLVRQLSLPK